MTVTAGGFEPDKLRFGKLEVYSSGKVESSRKTIRLTGLPIPNGGLDVGNGGGSIYFQSCTIESSGSFTSFCIATGAGGGIRLQQCTFVDIDSSTVVTRSMQMPMGGKIICTNSAAMPGGGGLVRSVSDNINAYGSATAAGRINSNGNIIGIPYGNVTSTRTQTGVYRVTHNGGNIYSDQNIVLISPIGAQRIFHISSLDAGWFIVALSNLSGTNTDTAFYFAVF